MGTHIWAVFTLALVLPCQLAISDRSFGSSQSKYNDSKASLELIQPSCSSIQSEHQQYLRNYKQTSYDSEESTQMKLTSQRTNQSIIIAGEENSNLIIQITVANEHAKDTKLPIRNNTILFYILEQSSKKMVQSGCSFNHRLIRVQKLQNKLYEILVMLKQNENKEGSTFVTLQVKVQKTVKSGGINLEWLKEYEKKVQILYDQSTLLFLEGLEGWSTIEQSTQLYRAHHYKWKLYSAIELLLLIIVCIGELIYLRKLLHPSIVLI